jgi:hypothetical protein
MESLRRYIKNLSELETYTGILSSFDNLQLIRAEQDIDKLVGTFFEGAFAPSVFQTISAKPSEVTLTTTTATVQNLGYNTGYFDFCTLEILSGSNRGKRIAIETSTESGGTQTLTFFDTQTGLSGSPAVKIYQAGKFPMTQDVEIEDSIYYKSILDDVKQAVAYQYEYRVREGDSIDNVNTLTSWSRSKDSYREEYGDGSGQSNATNRVSPQALDLLSSYGFTTQSM